MDNKQIATVLEEIGMMIELSGGNPFKARAHYAAARAAESLKEPITGLIESGTLADVKGFGTGMVAKVTELVRTGRNSEYDELRASLPDGLFDMLRIPGMGPKKVRTVHEKLKINTIVELEYACLENRLALLEGFGAKSQENTLNSIKQLKKYLDRHLYSVAAAEAQTLDAILRSTAGLTEIHAAGEFRRACETISVIDLLVCAGEMSTSDIVRTLEKHAHIESVRTGDNQTITIQTDSGITAILHLTPEDTFAATLFHLTGAAHHVRVVEHRLKARNIRIEASKLYRGGDGERLSVRSEEDIYRAAELPYIEPELREGRGEIEAAIEGRLPNLITPGDIRGVLHVHTHFSDGGNSIEEMVGACIERGYEYLGIADHSKSAFYAHGLSEERIREQHEEIDRTQEKYPDFAIFKGIESDILQDGALDYADEVLGSFDFIIASVHSQLNMSEQDATERIERAVRSPYTTILGHPTGRMLLAREGYPLDWERIMCACAENDVVIELNANPWRLDLDWRLCPKALQHGIRLSINPDAHSIQGVDDIQFGIGVARKGWVKAHDVICTMTARELKAFFKERKEQHRISG